MISPVQPVLALVVPDTAVNKVAMVGTFQRTPKKKPKTSQRAEAQSVDNVVFTALRAMSRRSS